MAATPEEQAKIEEASDIFSTHIRISHTFKTYRLDGTQSETKVSVCNRCKTAWPCKEIERARELTADLAEEVD